MPDQERMTSLIEKLVSLSAEDKLAWVETANEETFQTAHQKFVIMMSRQRDNNWSWDYQLQILDTTGKLLEEVWDNDLRQCETSDGVRLPEAMKNLHDLARRRAHRVDEKLSDLLASLDKIR